MDHLILTHRRFRPISVLTAFMMFCVVSGGLSILDRRSNPRVYHTKVCTRRRYIFGPTSMDLSISLF